MGMPARRAGHVQGAEVEGGRFRARPDCRPLRLGRDDAPALGVSGSADGDLLRILLSPGRTGRRLRPGDGAVRRRRAGRAERQERQFADRAGGMRSRRLADPLAEIDLPARVPVQDPCRARRRRHRLDRAEPDRQDRASRRAAARPQGRGRHLFRARPGADARLPHLHARRARNPAGAAERAHRGRRRGRSVLRQPPARRRRVEALLPARGLAATGPVAPALSGAPAPRATCAG